MGFSLYSHEIVNHMTHVVKRKNSAVQGEDEAEAMASGKAGGGVYVSGRAAFTQNVQVSQNKAENGGGIFITD